MKTLKLFKTQQGRQQNPYIWFLVGQKIFPKKRGGRRGVKKVNLGPPTTAKSVELNPTYIN